LICQRVQYAKRDSKEIAAITEAQAEKVKKSSKREAAAAAKEAEKTSEAKKKAKSANALANIAMLQGWRNGDLCEPLAKYFFL
jgi:sRNA-binding protein